MRKFLKRSLKTTFSYGAGVFLFTFFLIAPISMENNRNTWIAVYSFVFFVFTCIFLYKQMWKEGSLEKRENGGINPPWHKGLLYVLAGFSPFLLLEILYFIIYPGMAGGLGANIFHAVFRCGFGPMYFIIRLLGYKWYAYLISTVIIPVIGFIGFLAGTQGTGIKNIIAERRREEEDFLS
ncbi:MAG: hypothetical protein R3232_07225 [Clostridia bacterium]|nr:hypothetical protein [Clostridia bacterium]